MDIHMCEPLKGNSGQANSSVLIIVYEEHLAENCRAL
jgi:hypothetical protein